MDDPEKEVQKHKQFFKNRDMTCRIYIGKDGINGQASGLKEDALAYIEWLKSDPRFEDIDIKIHTHHENVFPRVSIKERKEIVALGQEVDFSKQAKHLTPTEWKEMLESNEEKFLIDVRNEYETAIGHFEGSVLPKLNTFKEFREYAKELANTLDPNTVIMMCCTGGIRCEAFSPFFIEKGFTKIYQLKGGIVRYGLEEGAKYWKGKLFVFDERLAVPLDGNNTPPISVCKYCDSPCDVYYNCANCDCNDLFLSCSSCLHLHQGCCSQECVDSPRIRPYVREGNKPFKRLHVCSLERISSICS